MHHRTLVTLALLAALLPACAGTSSKKSGPAEVDGLLGRIEKVQVEALLSRERAQDAYEALDALAAPGFQGDAVVAYEHLMQAVDQSAEQAVSFSASISPMKEAANDLFLRWTANLESFGNSSMREKSQARLEATRARYDGVLSAAVAAKIAFDAYNSALHDQALFLEQDFNADSLAVVAGELVGLEGRGIELSRRLDACAQATRAYLQSAALPGQLGEPAPAPEASAARDTESLRREAARAQPGGGAMGSAAAGGG